MENEASSATTRQYAQQQPAGPYDASYQSQLAQARVVPENRSGGQPPGSVHLYHDQIGLQNPNYPVNNYPANYQQAAPKKPSALKWILLALSCVVLVSGGISAMVISVLRSQEPERVERIAPPPRPPEPPQPPTSASGSALEQYKYPNAKVEKTVKVQGNQVIEMTTSDSVSKVGDYYKKLLGPPMVESSDDSVVFQIPGPPMTIITINQADLNANKTEIKVVQTNFPFPKIN